MAKKTYTEALEENTRAIKELLRQKSVSPEDTAAVRLLGMRLDALTEQGKETNNLLRAQNGDIRQHGKLLSKHCQWIEDHTDETHKAISQRMDQQDKKLTRATFGETVLALIAGGIAWFK